MDAEDFKLLELIRQQEENDRKQVDDNSLLAHLTQLHDDEALPSQSLLQEIFQQSQLSLEEKMNKTVTKQEEFDSDDELFNDFNMTMPNMEVFSECVGGHEESIPQLDGLHDGFDEKKDGSSSKIFIK